MHNINIIRQYRNVLSPPFHFDTVKKWIGDFHSLTIKLLDQWAQHEDKPVDVTHWMPLFTLDVLGVTVMSRQFNAMQGAENSDIEALKILLGSRLKPKLLILGMVSIISDRYSSVAFVALF